MNYVKSLNEFNNVNEAFEVHYSDGIRGMQKFNDKNKAIKFMKDKIASSKNLKEIAIYNASSGFHSTADTDAVITWWGEGSYLDNVSKKDAKLAAKKLEESAEVNEAKALPLDKLVKMIGDKPSCYDLADFIYTNYDKVTGLRKSMRNDEMDFPDEIMDVVDHYGLDIDEFTDCYGMAAESLELNEGVVSIKGGRIIAHKVLNKLVDMEVIPVKKKTDDLLEVVAKVITDAKMEAAEITEKKKDGTISDDEEEREDDLMANVESTIDDLIATIKKEANEIGGSFRSPGIEHRIGQLIKAKLQKSKLI